MKIILRTAWGYLLVHFIACAPDASERASTIDDVRILAIQGDPPESEPGEDVTYRAFVADPHATFDASTVRWSFCTNPKPLTENNAISAECVASMGIPVAESATTARALTPPDACRLFGPDPPPGDFRPRDADITGGYYQPIRVASPQGLAFGFQRVRCNLSSATPKVARAFREGYRKNLNPSIIDLHAVVEGSTISISRVPSNERVTLRVYWTPESHEDYLRFDPSSGNLEWRTETLTVSWYVDIGTLASDRALSESGDSADNDLFVSPNASQTTLWLVLRDERGGVAFSQHLLRFVPSANLGD